MKELTTREQRVSLYLLGFVEGVQRKEPTVLIVDSGLQKSYSTGYEEGRTAFSDVQVNASCMFTE